MATGREENIAEESTLAETIPSLSVSFCLFVCYLFAVPHMLANGGGTTTMRMVATTTGREENITDESTLAMLPVCFPQSAG